MMIDQVTRPFIDFDDEDDRKEAVSWSVGDDNNLNTSSYDNIDFTINNSKNKPKGKQITNLEDINIADLGI